MNSAAARKATMPTIPALDGLRACAFLIVFVAHGSLLQYSVYIPAAFGVMLFFFLSGYLITTILRIEAEQSGTISLRAFYRSRILRIFPPLYITYGLFLLLTWTGLLWASVNWLGTVSSLGFFYNYAQISGFNVRVPVGMELVWTLCVEEHFYLLFPWLYWWMLRTKTDSKKQVRLLLWICVAVAVWRAIAMLVLGFNGAGGLGWIYAATDTRLDSLLFGSILALRNNPICGERIARLDRHPRWTLFAGSFLILLTMVQRNSGIRETYRYDLQGLGLYLIFYYLLAWPESGPARMLSWKPLRWIGWLSYTLYLVHQTVLRALDHYHPDHSVQNLFVGFVICIVYAMGMRWWVELPLRRLRN